MPRQPPEEESAREQQQGIGVVGAQPGDDFAGARHVEHAKRHWIVDDHDGQKTGDERAEVIAFAEPDADGTSDQREAQAPKRERRTHVAFTSNGIDLLLAIVPIVHQAPQTILLRLGEAQVLLALQQVDLLGQLLNVFQVFLFVLVKLIPDHVHGAKLFTAAIEVGNLDGPDSALDEEIVLVLGPDVALSHIDQDLFVRKIDTQLGFLGTSDDIEAFSIG